MPALIRTCFLILAAPFLVLLIWAHLLRPWPGGYDFAALGVAALVGGAGIATAPWRPAVKAAAWIPYLVAAALILPIGGLLAICTTGDCL